MFSRFSLCARSDMVHLLQSLDILIFLFGAAGAFYADFIKILFSYLSVWGFCGIITLKFFAFAKIHMLQCGTGRWIACGFLCVAKNGDPFFGVLSRWKHPGTIALKTAQPFSTPVGALLCGLPYRWCVALRSWHFRQGSGAPVFDLLCYRRASLFDWKAQKSAFLIRFYYGKKGIFKSLWTATVMAFPDVGV